MRLPCGNGAARGRACAQQCSGGIGTAQRSRDQVWLGWPGGRPGRGCGGDGVCCAAGAGGE